MKNRQNLGQVRTLAALFLLGVSSFGCRPGYLKASDLESSGQGPAACAKSCEEIGMRMAALVLVGNSLPGCVCQPVAAQAPAQKAETPPAAGAPAAPAQPEPAPAAAPGPDAVNEGAAASTTGFVVIAAAVAAERAQEERRRRAQVRDY